jgi:alcohol dehydrogenase (cytochrome c)
MTADVESKTGYGPRFGVIRPGSDPNKYMNIGKINVETGEMKVIYSQPQGTNGSLLTTAGGLVFFGDLNRRMRAIDAEDGKVLWESIVGGMVMVSTISYAVNGKQYVMVFTGTGQSLTNNVLTLTKGVMAPAVLDSGVYVFALP